MKKSKLELFSIQYEFDRTNKEVKESPISEWFIRQQAKLNNPSS